jgi:hypothetical protein
VVVAVVALCRVTHAGSGVTRRTEVVRRSPIREAPSHASFATTDCTLDLGGPPRLRGCAFGDIGRELSIDRSLAPWERGMWGERVASTVVLGPIAMDELIDCDRERLVHGMHAPGREFLGRDLSRELGKRADPLRPLRLKRHWNLDDLAFRDRRAGRGEHGGCSPKLPSPLPARLAAPDRKRSSQSDGDVLAASGASDRRRSCTRTHLSPDLDGVFGSGS